MKISIFIFALLLMIAIGVAACNGGDETVAVDSVCALEPAPPIDPEAGPPALPFIFSGNYYVDGELGPEGQSVYVKLITSRSQIGTTREGGVYPAIAHGPVSEQDWGTPFIFCLGTPDGSAVPAEETFEYENLGRINNVNLDLHFPRFPE